MPTKLKPIKEVIANPSPESPDKNRETDRDQKGRKRVPPSSRQMNRSADTHDCLITGLRTLGPLSAVAEAELRKLPLRHCRVAPGNDVLSEGERPSTCSLIIDGFFVRHTSVAGGGRQILSVHLPGDVPDLHSLHIPAADFSLGAVTAGSVACLPHDALRRAMEAAPDLSTLLWRLTLADAAMMRARLVGIGRRTAYQRMAHFLCETYLRMRALDLAEEAGFTMPLTQSEIGDALGLSAVHVNRTLQQLRNDGVIVSSGRYFGVPDWRRLQDAGEFSRDCLSNRVSAPLCLAE